ncbi:MAG: GatB/YqeY domain-containing protein [Geovibrio sp.]|nr:GatB/YqeY domain-containing protein [Geovibrio sp.]
MSLKDIITEDMKTYMREKKQIALDTVRMLRSEIKNVEINNRPAGELDDEGVLKVIASAVKKRRDAAQQYKDAGRPELAEKEELEITFLEKIYARSDG